MSPDDERFDAKTTVLIENVAHHMDEEEQDWFPKVREGLGRKKLQSSASRMIELKKKAPRSPPSPGPEEDHRRGHQVIHCAHRGSRRAPWTSPARLTRLRAPIATAAGTDGPSRRGPRTRDGRIGKSCHGVGPVIVGARASMTVRLDRILPNDRLRCIVDATADATVEHSDADLLAAVRAGDDTAYAELWTRHQAAARRMARQIAPPGDVDDLVSESYYRVLRAIKAGGGPQDAFRPYLFSTMRRFAIDTARSPAAGKAHRRAGRPGRRASRFGC